MRFVGSVCAMLIAGACQTVGAAPQPAQLMPGDAAAMDQLKAALAKEMGRSPVDIGPSDPTRSSTISVLPVPGGPLNDRDMALPTVFKLETDGQVCALVREGTAKRIALDGVTCRVAS